MQKNSQKVGSFLNVMEESVTIPKNKYEAMQKIIASLHDSLGNLLDLMASDNSAVNDKMVDGLKKKLSVINEDLELTGAGSTLEGVFDGVKMIANDGQAYEVPANYASKSKLIEGDILKLTLKKGGSYIFKQISPVERKRVVGVLSMDETSGEYYVLSGGKVYKVNPASVTFYKGELGNDVILLVPKDGMSSWAAIENIIKK